MKALLFNIRIYLYLNIKNIIIYVIIGLIILF